MTWCIEYRVECVLLLIHSCTSVCSITWFESTRHSYILPYPGFHYHCLTLIDKSWIIMWRPGCNWGEGLWSNHTERIFINLLQFSFSVYNVYLKAYSSFLAVSMRCMTPAMLGIWMGVCLGNRLLVRNYVCLYDHTTLKFSFCLTNKVKHVVLRTWMGEHLETASAIFILNFSLLSVSNEGAWVKLQLPHTCKCTNTYTEQGNSFHIGIKCAWLTRCMCVHTPRT